ncbi:MAG TPA: molybdopterin-dependent oxidoreductase, partial [Acidimicrobiia bacterium]|nr:molybdopterin-dependent oxidoreductase [Acidimicrobiia bacterium]
MDKATSQDLRWIEGKDSRLEVLSSAPLVLSTPVTLLAGRRITDKESLFVRNIQHVVEAHSLESQPIEGWEIELTGLIDPSQLVVHARDLLEMDQVEYEMVLQCSGNGRSQYQGTPGTPWTQGGMANVRFSGVPLGAVLHRHNVRVDPRVSFVTAVSADLTIGQELPDLEHSLPVAHVLEKSILALSLNGEPLPLIHGGPVRLVTPGF